MLWPTDLWLVSLMPWLIVTRLPAAFYAAMLVPIDMSRQAPRESAEIIPFPVRRAAAG